jgi:hypothetical protein
MNRRGMLTCALLLLPVARGPWSRDAALSVQSDSFRDVGGTRCQGFAAHFLASGNELAGLPPRLG